MEHEVSVVHVTRVGEAVRYDAPRHFDMAAVRLQGHEASPTTRFWVGLSHFLPGGGAQESASPLERVYVVVEGQVTVTDADGHAVILEKWDSVSFREGEPRSILNTSAVPASMVVVMPYAEGSDSP